MKKLVYFSGTAALMSSMLLLSGCGGGQQSLKQELETMSKDLPSGIKPLPVVKPYDPFPYEAQNMRDPFANAQVAQEAVASKGGVAPDANRAKDPLEEYSLDQIKMVGSLSRDGVTTALVKVEGSLFNVGVGRYMGQDFGRVVGVTKSSIQLKEIVRDSSNFWTERTNKLDLQENETEGKKQ